ncbi:hypothetical protein GH714_043428 [Hevea brasiliensis]|uniref:PPM-type phosphatase domain-containing protein n=1 Tax=Hevea brasiliensis TaxID=3981 RepID=A0A6A6K3V2_HEVBR|nr:hypothetical protein GH714_043428 [Hevea brasiliensis]
MGSCLSAESRSPRPGTPSSPAFGIKKRKNSKKRPGSRNSSFDYRREEPLHRIPGRLFLNGSSNIASLFTQQGKKGTNQDAMIVWENFGLRTDTVFCGVFDGHGPYGHMVAKRVRDHLPLKLSAHLEVNKTSEDVLKEISLSTTGSMNSEDTAFISADEESRASVDLGETEKHPEIFQTLKESFLKAFKIMDRELRLHANIDCFCSGTTAVTLVKKGQYLVIGNVGDSRAVLGTRDKDDSLVAVQLTVDLKPNLPAEAERIRKCKGRVFALQDEPEIWDVLSNKEVVDIVSSAPSRSSAARALVESAVRAWRYKYPTSKVDDCAVVCLFLDTNNLSTASNSTKEQPTSVDQTDIDSQKEDDPSGATGLGRSGTVRSGKEVLLDGSADEDSSKQDEMQLESGIEWSALEGVSRVNTLLNLPRFVPGKEDKKAARETKTRK